MEKFTELTRRQIRYLCFRLMTETEGGSKAKVEKEGLMQWVSQVKEHIEAQEDFGGWNKFAKTWDVDEKAPLVVVLRTSSIQTEWLKTLKASAQVLTDKNHKFLNNKLSQAVQRKKKSAKVAKVKIENLD